MHFAMSSGLVLAMAMLTAAMPGDAEDFYGVAAPHLDRRGFSAMAADYKNRAGNLGSKLGFKSKKNAKPQTYSAPTTGKGKDPFAPSSRLDRQSQLGGRQRSTFAQSPESPFSGKAPDQPKYDPHSAGKKFGHIGIDTDEMGETFANLKKLGIHARSAAAFPDPEAEAEAEAEAELDMDDFFWE